MQRGPCVLAPGALLTRDSGTGCRLLALPTTVLLLQCSFLHPRELQVSGCGVSSADGMDGYRGCTSAHPQRLSFPACSAAAFGVTHSMGPAVGGRPWV